MGEVAVSIKLSPKQAGALYMLSEKRKDRIIELEQQLKTAKALNESMYETINHINSMEDSYSEPEDILAEILLTANIARCEYANNLEGK